MTRSDVANYAMSLIGTPFVLQGRLPGVGLDCVGVVVSIMKHFGIPCEDYVKYRLVPEPGQLYYYLGRQLETTITCQTGDIVFLSIKRTYADHVAIFNGFDFIHACNIAKRVTITPHCLFGSKILSTYQFPGVQ